MKALEPQPRYVNKLAHSSSPYLRQHAHNPVFWYPWGEEAIERARRENKPILLSIGYSTCYWCHVMEREVFENPSIAALMNENFVNIKIDREEHPDLDEIYMVARQVMTREGGWPNNVFLTPDLKPFHGGGTSPPADTEGRPGFPRLLEWLHYAWTTQERDVRESADTITEAMRQFLEHTAAKTEKMDVSKQAVQLLAALKRYHDESAGGFFQAPKFPHEQYVSFLLAYHEKTGSAEALSMAMLSLRKMAAGGIYDHVGCGFHRYAVDKEWYVPHFEKMLYNQAQLARVYTDAARISGNPWLADIARSILEFTLGLLTDGGGAFYSAIDAETDGIEGAYYAWSAEELQSLLPEEGDFFVSVYALADIPKFPGHKHVEGQAIILRKPLDDVARERGMPYVQLAAMCSHVMNKLLVARNLRKPPRLDDKIIVGWNGLMIDAFAHAGSVFNRLDYIVAARKAADFLLEHAIDDEGGLCRIVAGGKAQIEATLEDYACLVKGLLTLHRAAPDQALLEACTNFMQRADELFYDTKNGGYFFTRDSGVLPFRIKNADDSALPNANAVMISNLIALHELTGDAQYSRRAESLRDLFLAGTDRPLVEKSAMMAAALLLSSPLAGEGRVGSGAAENIPDIEPVTITSSFNSNRSELTVTLSIQDGWHINANPVDDPSLVPTQVELQGEGVEITKIVYPASGKMGQKLVYAGVILIKIQCKSALPRLPLKLMVRYQPCTATACHAVRDISLTI